jgi:hypothetical protein
LPVSGDEICLGTQAERAALAAALADTEDLAALASGAALLRKLDAGCAG